MWMWSLGAVLLHFVLKPGILMLPQSVQPRVSEFSLSPRPVVPRRLVPPPWAWLWP